MRIAVISDTHDSVSATREVLETIKKEGVGTFIHCGDMSSTFTAELFHDFCVYHARGNNDLDAIGLKLALQECKAGSCSEKWIKCVFDGKLIGALHDMYSPLFSSMIDSGEFSYIFVGHTHRKMDEMMGTTRVINPGAIGGAYRGPRGFCILDLETGEKTDYGLE